MAVAVTPLDVGIDVTAGVVVVGFTTAAVVTWRRLSRRLRALRSGPAARGVVAVYEAARAPGGFRSGATVARLRIELWQGVSATTQSVRRAREAGAPLGELPALTRRLREAAEELDRLLSIASGVRSDAPAVAELRAQVEEALRAAEAIRLAALSAAGDTAAVRLRDLATDAEREVQCVAAGVARSRTALSKG